tara:strand:+ start:827 stop:1072 length:246 start_codon:yes stop_codon:yes gene_type:complete
MKYNDVYFDEVNQKIIWTRRDEKEIKTTYNLLGKCTNVEFDLLIELLFLKYEDSAIDFVDIQKIFINLRSFCDTIKNNYSL